jgi:YidC/Oxa1 family membrane protein insertase
MIKPLVFNESSWMTKLLYKPLLNVLFLFYAILPVKDLGLAIIALTIVIRLVLFPSYLANLRSSQKMRELQPHLNAIKDKHKGDQKLQAEATMALYKEHKVNPMGSCLSAIIQLPVLFALYRVFSFGISDDILTHLYSWFPIKIDHVNTIFLSYLPWDFLHVDLLHRSITLAILAGLAQFWQVWLTMKTTPMSTSGNQAMMTNQMMYLFPAMTIVIGISLPAALTLYWLVTTLLTGWQQVYAIKTYRPSITSHERPDSPKPEGDRPDASDAPRLNG